jgi:hypothetical protein
MLFAMKVPGDFDVAQISWRPDYDSFFYQQLSRRALRIYLFRDEYIFELERAVVVETPQLGNATYLFTKPQSMHAFLAAYTRVSKDDIRRNRANIGEKLGFLGRIIHGSNPRSWAKELKARIGENAGFRNRNHRAQVKGQRCHTITLQKASEHTRVCLNATSQNRLSEKSCKSHGKRKPEAFDLWNTVLEHVERQKCSKIAFVLPLSR